MLVSLLGLVCGLLALLIGGTALLRGASNIATSLGVPPLVVGLTIVAFGTSAPELVVNVVGALSGETELAFGNVTGSNLANVGLVLGSAALLTSMHLNGQVLRRELPLLLLAGAMLIVLTVDPLLRDQPNLLDRSDALVLLLMFSIFVYVTANDLLRQGSDPLAVSASELIAVKPRLWLDSMLLLGGMAGLTVGGQLTIHFGAQTAVLLGLPSVLVGMLIVAVGTSLPEFVTSIIAAIRKEADLCVGNVVGSNLFNTLFVLPISALIHPLEVPTGGVWDLVVALLMTLLIAGTIMRTTPRLGRVFGVVLLVTYFGWMGYRLIAA